MSIKKITGLGTDSRKIAALLQAKAPKGHMLAYISPKEAEILKSRGGSGREHGDTGIMSFENPDDYEMDFGPRPEDISAETPTRYAPPEIIGDYSVQPTPKSFQTVGGQGLQAGGEPSIKLPQIGTPAYQLPQTPSLNLKQVQQPSFMQATPEKRDDEFLKKLIGIGVEGLFGAMQSRKAAEQGQAAKREQQAIAKPYQKQGQELIAQAQRGELAPAAQQSLQAAQAQAAQAVQSRGGVGALQVQNQIQMMRQQLLSQQQDYGLKLSNIGDQIALGAIRAGMEADQMVNNLTSSYFSNLMRTFSGTPTQASTQAKG